MSTFRGQSLQRPDITLAWGAFNGEVSVRQSNGAVVAPVSWSWTINSSPSGSYTYTNLFSQLSLFTDGGWLSATLNVASFQSVANTQIVIVYDIDYILDGSGTGDQGYVLIKVTSGSTIRQETGPNCGHTWVTFQGSFAVNTTRGSNIIVEMIFVNSSNDNLLSGTGNFVRVYQL
jgi:hypothetical protein